MNSASLENPNTGNQVEGEVEGLQNVLGLGFGSGISRKNLTGSRLAQQSLFYVSFWAYIFPVL